MESFIGQLLGHMLQALVATESGLKAGAASFFNIPLQFRFLTMMPQCGEIILLFYQFCCFHDFGWLKCYMLMNERLLQHFVEFQIKTQTGTPE